MAKSKKLTTAAGAPVPDNQNAMTAGPRGPMLMQDVWYMEKLAHFDREVIPERRMHAKGSGAFGKFTVTNDITQYTRAKIFSKVGKETEVFVRFSTVAGERGAADAERDIRGFAMKFYTEEGMGFLNFPPRSPAPCHHHDERARHPLLLPPHARLWQPHLQHDQHQGGTRLGQIPLAYPAGHQESDRPAGRNHHCQGPRKPPARPVREHRKRRFPPLELYGAADHWNFREDDSDYYTQPGKLFRMMNKAQKKALFENTARAMGDAPEFIKIRHIGNCLKADPAYGKGVADALGIPLDKVK